MFIGQNVSLEERCAAQAVRRAVAATTTASPATLATATATAISLWEPAGASLDAPHHAPTTTAPSDTIAVAYTPQLLEPTVASLARPRCSPGPGDLVPRKFPGKRTHDPLVSAIFSLMDRIQPHVEGNNEESKIDNNENEDEDDDDNLVF